MRKQDILSELENKIKLSDNFVILDTAQSDEDNSVNFGFFDPIKIIQTNNIKNVKEKIQELEKFIKKGYFAAGYISYEAGFAFEPALNHLFKPQEHSCPILWFGIYDSPQILIDNKPNSSENNDLSENSAYIYDVNTNLSKEDYLNAISRIKNYIRDGHTYQINYTFKTKFKYRGTVLSLYRMIRKNQNSSYCAFIKNGENYILSFSPELFFRKSGNKITAKPMKGTMKRGKTPSDDQTLLHKLQNSEKNQAENVMIVDLLRNDLNRISCACTVNVPSLFKIEKYNTVFQMTSTIEAQLPAKITIYDIFKNLFPCGSITGAPKKRSMEIINELEKGTRNIYTGSIGYISPENDAVFNVAIRTLELCQDICEIGIGGGIVWDSSPEEEYQEALLKMKFLTKANPDFHILETMLLENGQYKFLSEHISRMKQSALFFRYSFNELELLNELDNILQSLDNKSYKIRILLNEDGTFYIEHAELKSIMANGVVGKSFFQADETDIFLYHKTTNRQLYNLMYKKAVENNLDDIIFFNREGYVTEGCISNIFIEKAGILYTPDVSCGLLNGIMRQHIIKNNSAVEKTIRIEDILSADKVYISNSVRGFHQVDFQNKFYRL